MTQIGRVRSDDAKRWLYPSLALQLVSGAMSREPVRATPGPCASARQESEPMRAALRSGRGPAEGPDQRVRRFRGG